MLASVKDIFSLLGERERSQIFWVALSMTVTAVLELIGVTSIFPFISVIANPELIHTNKYYSWTYNYFGFQQESMFIYFLGALVLLTTISSACINVLTNFKIIRFSEVTSSALANRLLKSYMDRPYTFFLNRNSADLTKNVLSEVNQFTTGVLLPLLQGIARLLVLFALITLLFWVQPVVALSSMLIFGGSYLVIFLFIKKKMTTAGKSRLVANKNKHQAVAKAFGGIKEIKLLNNANFFLQDFKRNFDAYARYQVVHQVYTLTPRYILEALAFGSIVAFMLFMYGENMNLINSLPTLSLFAIVGYKILPALQVVYNSVTRIKFYSSAVTNLKNDLDSGIETSKSINHQPIRFQNEISISHLTFTYPESSKQLFSDLSLTIKANTTVAFVGTTGAGKTTLVDIIMGLLPFNSGSINVDGTSLVEENIEQWKAMFGYVPQRIYLSDESVSKNIAFGIEEHLIDQEKIERVARMAKIHDFIVNELPLGYETKVGDRGVRLSGGQSQRIGIARALYRDPSILVLDEATSALDNLTETEVINTIKSLNGNCTILMIAHRLSTVENCDKIVLLEHGEIVAEGTYATLLRDVKSFRNLAGVNQ